MRTIRLAIVVMLSLCATRSMASDLPIVNVSMSFEATMYLNAADLGDAGRKKVIDAAVLAFVTEARKTAHYPFLQWVKGDPTQKNQLTIVVSQRPVQHDQEVDLEYRGTIGGQPLGGPPIIPLYKWTEGKKTSDADALALDVTRVIGSSIDQIQRGFVARVPIATEASIDESNRRIVVPVAASKLQVDEENTLLSVWFVGDNLSSSMKLRQPAQRGDSSLACRILEFSFADVTIDSAHEWNDRFPAVFRAVRVTGVTVDRYQYKAFLGTLPSDE